MLVECGFVRAVDGEGQDWTFTPSLRNIAALGDPHEIVRLYAGLHGPDSEKEAAYVLAGLCDQDDPTPLLGHWEFDAVTGPQVMLREVLPLRPGSGYTAARYVPGRMPAWSMVVIARHLMRHGIIGEASPEGGGGKFSASFNAWDFVAEACVHLGISQEDAERLSMTGLQRLFSKKFPKASEKARDVPNRDEYQAAMKRVEELKGKRNAR